MNSSDRTIRLYRIVYDGDDNRIVDLFLEHKFQDIVTKLQYTACGFSSNCDYVFGGSSLCHNIFVWDAHTGALLKILEGPKDCVVFASWHPYRPMIASVSAFGIIYVWAKTLQENWSAFAPQFKELESNLIYKELETEFDFTDDLNETGTVDSLESFVDVDTVDQTMNQLQHALLSIPVTIEDYIDF